MVSLQLLFASTFLINGNAVAPIYWSYPLSDRLLVHVLMVGALQYIFSIAHSRNVFSAAVVTVLPVPDT